WDAAVLHYDLSVYDDGFHVITDAAFNNALDRVTNRAIAQGIAPCQVNDDDVCKGTRRQSAEILPADRFSTAKRCGLEDLPGGGREVCVAHNLAEVGGSTHIHYHVARIGIRADGHVYTGSHILLPIVEDSSA